MTAQHAQALVSAVAKESPWRATAVNSSSLIDYAQPGLAAASRLRQYRDYLAQARAYKASVAGNSDEIDRQVLVEARGAVEDAHTVATAAVAIVANLVRGGALDQMVRSWHKALPAGSTVSTHELWKHATTNSANRDAIREAGLDDLLFAALDATIAAADAHVGVDGDRLRLTGGRDGHHQPMFLATAPRTGLATSVPDLVGRGRFDSLADSLQRGEPAYLAGMPLAGDARAEDVALAGALDFYAEGVRHLRKLEDTGLETYAGASPGVLVAIVIILLVVGAVLVQYCSQQGIGAAPGGGTDPSAQDKCGLGGLLIVLSIVLILFGKGGPDPSSPTTLATGSVVIHGVVRDLQFSVA